MEIQDSRLATVIKVKEILLKRTQRELSALEHNRDKELHQLTRLEEKQEEALSESIRDLKVRATDLQTSRAFLQSLSRQIKKQQKRIQELRGQESAKRVELLGRSQSKQMLEKLAEKQQTEAAKEAERKAQRLIDVLSHRLKMGF